MSTSTFTVITLPNSIATDANHHVSVFIAPKLEPVFGNTTLENYPSMLDWARLILKQSKFKLFNQKGPIKSKPLITVINPDSWNALFPKHTPVLSPAEPKFENRHWRTFNAANVHDGVKTLNMFGIFSSPTTPPSPSAHVLSKVWGGNDNKIDRGYDERQYTTSYDELLGEFNIDDPNSLKQIESTISRLSRNNFLENLKLESHRARRFYERPETAYPYKSRPDDNQPPLPSPPLPIPDFHERCSLVGDHPAIQRQLALVVDFKVTNLAALKNSEWISTELKIDGADIKASNTRTRVQIDGKNLVTRESSADWERARLRIGDVEKFKLLDLDPDGSAIKFDRYFWSFPRLLINEDNGNDENAAPTALRSQGFTVVRRLQGMELQHSISRQKTHKLKLQSGDNLMLHTEDVTQGFRVEVYDQTQNAWWSLHKRHVNAQIKGYGKILENHKEEGFIQDVTVTEAPEIPNSPIHVHESTFGWSGWSLSAPKPGKRVVHDPTVEGGERIEDSIQPQNNDPTLLAVQTQVEPGTLPRLRYGRNYAFRARAVDLAGNSPTQSNTEIPGIALDSSLTASQNSEQASYNSNPMMDGLDAELRPKLIEIIKQRKNNDPLQEIENKLELSNLDDELLAAIRRHRGSKFTSNTSASRAQLVDQVFDKITLEDKQSLFWDSIELASVNPLITELRPFLRWDPVLPPAVITRQRFTEGESLLQIVIRSGVSQNYETGEILLTTPDEFANANPGHDYFSTSERHLAPPKTSQPEAELHGAFDVAIGTADPNQHAELLGAAVREAGTFFDLSVPRLDDHTQSDPQPGIRLDADLTVPDDAKKSLPLEVGEAPSPGQYIVHDTDQLQLPYLPDLVANGLAFVFHEAGKRRTIAFPFGIEGFTTAYNGKWPEIEPYRLVLMGSSQLNCEVNNNQVQFGLPAGDIQKFKLSSSLKSEDLELFGWWRSFPASMRDNSDVKNAVADGMLWAFTPSESVTLVHAVNRPIQAPRQIIMRQFRTKGSINYAFVGAIELHGASTDSISVDCQWQDPFDDLSFPEPQVRPFSATALTTPIQPKEDIALFSPTKDEDIFFPDGTSVRNHQAIHHIGDTLHHKISYRLRATTRFREYFAPEILEPSSDANPLDDGKSVVSEALTISVPSSAPPAAPMVHSVIPLFCWQQAEEPEQPIATRSRRLSGVRIYLQRPWFSSGEGELLGVVVAARGSDAKLENLVSHWGRDPIWVSADLDRRPLFLELDSVLKSTGFDNRQFPARPVKEPVRLKLTEGVSNQNLPKVSILGYQPQYNRERGLWYVDIAVDIKSEFWPFIRFSVVRYQPESLPDCHLSAPVLCDFVQLPPPRDLTVSRTDISGVRVVLSGPVGYIKTTTSGTDLDERTDVEKFSQAVRNNRLVYAFLQHRPADVSTDLGWESVATQELILRGQDDFQASWVGELTSPEALELKTPGSLDEWRVHVEEYEVFAGDPSPLPKPGATPGPAINEARLIYADDIML